jgi:hypothetical protein
MLAYRLPIGFLLGMRAIVSGGIETAKVESAVGRAEAEGWSGTATRKSSPATFAKPAQCL